jgi:hypothetical protein
MIVWVWSEDHASPHVHVATTEWEITIRIGELAQLERIKYGHPQPKAIRAAITLVAEFLDASNDEWRRCHG